MRCGSVALELLTACALVVLTGRPAGADETSVVITLETAPAVELGTITVEFAWDAGILDPICVGASPPCQMATEGLELAPSSGLLIGASTEDGLGRVDAVYTAVPLLDAGELAAVRFESNEADPPVPTLVSVSGEDFATGRAVAPENLPDVTLALPEPSRELLGWVALTLVAAVRRPRRHRLRG